MSSKTGRVKKKTKGRVCIGKKEIPLSTGSKITTWSDFKTARLLHPAKSCHYNATSMAPLPLSLVFLLIDAGCGDGNDKHQIQESSFWLLLYGFDWSTELVRWGMMGVMGARQRAQGIKSKEEKGHHLLALCVKSNGDFSFLKGRILFSYFYLPSHPPPDYHTLLDDLYPLACTCAIWWLIWLWSKVWHHSCNRCLTAHWINR